MPSTTKWEYVSGSNEIVTGLSPGQLADAVKAGQIPANTKIRKCGTGDEWKNAYEYNGFAHLIKRFKHTDNLVQSYRVSSDPSTQRHLREGPTRIALLLETIGIGVTIGTLPAVGYYLMFNGLANDASANAISVLYEGVLVGVFFCVIATFMRTPKPSFVAYIALIATAAFVSLFVWICISVSNPFSPVRADTSKYIGNYMIKAVPCVAAAVVILVSVYKHIRPRLFKSSDNDKGGA